MKRTTLFKSALALCTGALLMAAGESQATYITYSSADRTAGLGSATSVKWGPGNATAAVVNATLPTGDAGDPWVERGSVAGGSAGPGTIMDGDLTVEVLTGNWGSGGPLTGKWTINNPTFWSDYGFAAISLHVGNGGGEPDHWIWEITNGETTGTWNYEKLDGGGGGLSNLKLYSHGEGDDTTTVPEGGASFALMGLALAGLGATRRFLKKA